MPDQNNSKLAPKYLRVASDLHLEAFLGKRISELVPTFLPLDLRDSESVLMLAGDISSNQVQLTGFIKEIEDRFQKVFFIPGNHEYYRHDFDQWSVDIQEMFNEHLINTEYATNEMACIEYDTWRLIFGTYWADGGKDSWERAAINNGLNDFRLISTKKGTKNFHVNDMVDLHTKAKTQVKEWLEKPFDGTTVVMTHHMPSYQLCHPRFGSMINGGFASNSDDILHSEIAPPIWIHGHTHDTIDRKLWKTRIVCNPCGYRGEWNTPFTQYMNKFIKLENDLG